MIGIRLSTAEHPTFGAPEMKDEKIGDNKARRTQRTNLMATGVFVSILLPMDGGISAG